MPIAKKVFDYGIWVVFFTISTYASLFYVTKDAIPGDLLYGTKLGVEKVLIASSSLIYKQADFQIDFVTRRFKEVTKVLASQYGIDSLVRLDGQVVETAESIANIKDPNERKRAADKFITELSYISDELDKEEQKYVNTVTQKTNINPTVTPIDTRWYNPQSTGTIASSQNVVDQIDTTQNTITDTISTLETIKEQTSNSTGPTITPTPTLARQKTSSEFQYITNTPTPTITPVPTTSFETFPTNSPTPTKSQPTSTPKPTPTCAQGQSCYQHDD